MDLKRFLGCNNSNGSNINNSNSYGLNNNNNNNNNNNLDSTTLNVTIGGKNQSIVVPKTSTYKEMISIIKDKFNINSKSTLCIKCENSNGEMFSLASDCHIKKAYNQQPDNQPKELRIVANEIPQKKCITSELFTGSFFSLFGCSNNNNAIAQNYSMNTDSLKATTSLQHLASQPSPDYLKTSSSNTKSPMDIYANTPTTPLPPPSSTSSYYSYSNHQSPQQSSNNNSNNNSNINFNSMAHKFSMFPGHHIKPTHLSHHTGLYYRNGFNTNNNILNSINNNSNNKISTSPSQSIPIVQNSPPSSFTSRSPSSFLNNNNSINNNNNNNNNINNIKNNKSINNEETSMKFILENNKNSFYNTTTTTTTTTTATTTTTTSSSALNKIPSQLNLSSSSITTTNSIISNIDTDPELRRNESFEFMDEESFTSVTNGVCPMLNKTFNEDEEIADEQQKFINNGRPPLGTEACREIGAFIKDITKLFYKLRQTANPVEVATIKESICDKIQNGLTTMPWLLGFFPQLKQFANQSCPIFNVPPNTPPSSPSVTSPISELARQNSDNIPHASVFQVSRNSANNLNSIQSQLELQKEVDLMSQPPQPCLQQQQQQTLIQQQQQHTLIQQQHQQQQQQVKDQHPMYNSTNTNEDSDSSSSSCSRKNNNSVGCHTNVLRIIGPSVHRYSKCEFCKFSPIIGNLYECDSCPFSFCELCKPKETPSCPNDPSHKILIYAKPKVEKKQVTSSTGAGATSTCTPIRGCPYKRKTPKCTLGLKFISDVTLLFGSEVQPNEELTKIWRVQNTGPTLKGCLLVRVCGNVRLPKFPAIQLPTVAPGEIFNISVPIVIPPLSEGCEEQLVGEYWRICTANGLYFGEQLWISLVVKNKEVCDLSEKLLYTCNLKKSNTTTTTSTLSSSSTSSTQCTCRSNLVSCTNCCASRSNFGCN